MEAIILRGTPEEIRKVMQDQPLSTANRTLAVEQPAGSQPSKIRVENSEGPQKFVTAEFARLALGRRPISKPFKAVLDVLNDAYPEWVPRTKLLEAAGYTPPQFAGLMGAFGRRMAGTDGYDQEAHFFDWRWNEEVGEWVYRLPDTVREVLDSDTSG